MDIKSFFHTWCQKEGKSPNFDIRAAGPKHRQRFLCELRVDGYPYAGCGNSTSKKDASFNAARDFVQYLVRQGIVKESEVPQDGAPAGEFVNKREILCTGPRAVTEVTQQKLNNNCFVDDTFQIL